MKWEKEKVEKIEIIVKKLQNETYLKPKEKLSYLTKEMLRLDLSVLKCNSHTNELPPICEWTALHIYETVKDEKNVQILRLGNGCGQDLFVQKYFLKALGITPEFCLLDYSEEKSNISRAMNPEIAQSNYILHDLFDDFPENLKQRKFHIIDCQQILHEICAEGTGGSLKKFSNLLHRCFDLLYAKGLLLGEDVNICFDNQEKKLELKLSPSFQGKVKYFCQILQLSEKELLRGDLLICEQSFFENFCMKVRYINDDGSYNKRELQEIHRNLKIADWERFFRLAKFSMKEVKLNPQPQKQSQIIRDNILGNYELPAFSLFFCGQKESLHEDQKL